MMENSYFCKTIGRWNYEQVRDLVSIYASSIYTLTYSVVIYCKIRQILHDCQTSLGTKWYLL